MEKATVLMQRLSPSTNIYQIFKAEEPILKVLQKISLIALQR